MTKTWAQVRNAKLATGDWYGHVGHRDPPIPGDTRVEVMFNDGDTAVGVMHDWDQNWQWDENDTSVAGIIVAYRIIRDHPHNPT